MKHMKQKDKEDTIRKSTESTEEDLFSNWKKLAELLMLMKTAAMLIQPAHGANQPPSLVHAMNLKTQNLFHHLFSHALKSLRMNNLTLSRMKLKKLSMKLRKCLISNQNIKDTTRESAKKIEKVSGRPFMVLKMIVTNQPKTLAMLLLIAHGANLWPFLAHAKLLRMQKNFQHLFLLVINSKLKRKKSQ